jgi:hypothetical protein
MTDPNHEARVNYCRAKSLSPESIPGKRCLAGDYDHAPGFIEHVADMLRQREEVQP